MTSLRFDIKKTTEAASVLIELEGGEISYMKLLKLLYLADRKAYEEWERPITYDHYVSMDNGQVLNTTYRLVMRELDFENTYWSEYISEPTDYDIQFEGKPPEINKLSPAEINLLNRIYDKFGKFDQWELADITHALPEYEDPEGSSIPTDLETLLDALDYEKEDIGRIKDELKEEEKIKRVFSV